MDYSERAIGKVGFPMDFRGFFNALPLLHQVDIYHFYIKGYTEALQNFSEVRVVLLGEWLSGVPDNLKEYFFRVGFPCYIIPIFQGSNCYGFVVKGFNKETPKFCTNMLLPGCERITGGEIVVFVEGFKDSYVPMVALKDLPVVVVPMLTSVPSKELLEALKGANCSVLFVPDADSYIGNHKARFFELCGKIGIHGDVFELGGGAKDFGDFFDPGLRTGVLIEGKRLREKVKSLVTF